MSSNKKNTKISVRNKKPARASKDVKKNEERKGDLWKSWLQKVSQVK